MPEMWPVRFLETNLCEPQNGLRETQAVLSLADMTQQQEKMMKKILIIGVSTIALTACAEMGAVLDVIAAPPTDREVCESQQIGGTWEDGECFIVRTTKEPLRINPQETKPAEK